MEIHITDESPEQGTLQLVNDNNYDGVEPGDEVRESVDIYNDSSSTVTFDYAQEDIECTSRWTGEELPMDFNDEVYSGYRDAVPEEDIDGVYWGNDRVVTGGKGGDVQRHIDSGLWKEIGDYLNGKTLQPGESISIGRVLSFDGPKLGNEYMWSIIEYSAQVEYLKEAIPEPEPQPTPQPDPTPSVEPSPVHEEPVIDETYEEEPVLEITYVRTTGYTGDEGYKGKTASGTQVREGVLAGPREWLGRECYLLDKSGNVIGEYRFEDTGNPKYVNDERIDMYFETAEELAHFQQNVGDYTYILWK